ncbi:hypothetical protein J2R76_003552 [Bradyrhizobium sp. USDA 4532]|nr:hypothetical protein [Bradyrhizobium sp. USDA 4545]MCP1919961.1 hypothetical protein [Bradyrhizobium sp. USDA 4532]
MLNALVSYTFGAVQRIDNGGHVVGHGPLF